MLAVRAKIAPWSTGMLKNHHLGGTLALLLASLAFNPAVAQAVPTGEPGITLLIPYFEVDLDQPDGLTTLFSVSNSNPASTSRVLAHGIVWSDWGLPVYSWDFYLGPGDMVSYNVRDLVTYGAFPATHPPAGFGQHCARPLAAGLGPDALAALQRRLTGRPDPVDGLCSSEPRLDSSIATGSITIDYVRDCSHDGIDDPFDDGYLTGQTPIAGELPTLFGDFFLVNPAADLAEGYSAYALHRAASSGDTFWEGIERPNLRREPLSTAWRLRFLVGGPFAARTSFFVYHRRVVPPAPAACETVPLGASPHGTWSFDVYSESGTRVLHDWRVANQGRRTAEQSGQNPLPQLVRRRELEHPGGAVGHRQRAGSDRRGRMVKSGGDDAFFGGDGVQA